MTFSLQFDVGYIVGSNKICFSQSDDIKTELVKIQKKGYNLWCEGLNTTQKRPLSVLTNDSVHVIDDSDEENNTNAPPSKREKMSTFDHEERKQTIQKIANTLHDKHGSMLNMVQYRLWAEALHSKQHISWDEPSKGLPWGDGKKLKFKSKERMSKSATDSVMHSFADMASTIASALKPSTSSPQPKQSSSPKPHGSAPSAPPSLYSHDVYWHCLKLRLTSDYFH